MRLLRHTVYRQENKRLNRQVPGNVLIELGHTELQRRPQADMLYSICLVPVRLLSVNRYRLPCTACSIVQSNKLSMLLLRTITRDYTEFGVFINSTACNLCAAKRSPWVELGYTPWGRKKIQFSFVWIFFNTWRRLVNFFTYIKESISYNCVYLILACVKNFA